MTPPDLKDPAQLTAYRAELRGVAKPLRYTGLFFAVIGVILAIARTRYPAIPAIIPMAALALAALNMLAGVAARMRYHQRRMKGE